MIFFPKNGDKSKAYTYSLGPARTGLLWEVGSYARDRSHESEEEGDSKRRHYFVIVLDSS